MIRRLAVPVGLANPHKSTRLDSLRRNSLSGKGEETHKEMISHVFPTFSNEHPDLALIVGVWNPLTSECKHRLLEIAQANRPDQCQADD